MSEIRNQSVSSIVQPEVSSKVADKVPDADPNIVGWDGENDPVNP